MHNLPFDKPGRFYRGNLHTHSTQSDGKLSPEAVCARYRELGYDFLALTDHFMGAYDFPVTDTRPYRNADFTTILGAELHGGATEFGEWWHLLAVGLPLDFAPTPPDQSGPELAARALAAGAYLAIAHPAWYVLSEADVMSIDGAHAIEVYNTVSHDHNDRADSLYMLDVMLNRGRRLLACATDDAHFDPEQRDIAGGWVMVRAEALEPDALLAALKAGHYYSSSGPAIHDIQVEPRQEIYVRCSPAERIFVTGRTWEVEFAYGPGITEARLDIARFKSDFCRVTVRDAHGGRAWSNPIWMD
jgi:hypothetical protein